MKVELAVIPLHDGRHIREPAVHSALIRPALKHGPQGLPDVGRQREREAGDDQVHLRPTPGRDKIIEFMGARLDNVKPIPVLLLESGHVA